MDCKHELASSYFIQIIYIYLEALIKQSNPKKMKPKKET